MAKNKPKYDKFKPNEIGKIASSYIINFIKQDCAI